MTEEEAKTKGCCGPPGLATAVLLASGAEVGMPPGHSSYGMCIGSACMAWRWDRKQPLGHGFYGDGTPHAEGANGYCGLAGSIS